MYNMLHHPLVFIPMLTISNFDVEVLIIHSSFALKLLVEAFV